MIGNAPLVGAISVIRQIYWLGRMRIRQWGRVPLRRGATVLVANHQHEDESEIVCERVFLQGPWKRPVFTASSRRMYEPGFFATRMPALRFARRWNAGSLFLLLGLLPIEHELSSRPLASIAATLAAKHGDLRLEEAFRPEALAAVPAAQRFSDLLRKEHFDAAHGYVRVALVREPYRREILEATRTAIDADIAQIVGIVREGATFFVTPEGEYSSDGRMRPLRGIVEHLVRVAEPWLVAIAFDPFRGRRLSMLFRIVRPADPADLATSLAAARPINASALLAERLAQLDDAPFTRDELVEALRVARDELEAGLFVDPELRDPARCVDEAIVTLERRATLVRDGDRLRLGSVRTDGRFPQVRDIVAYQRNFLAETRTAARRLAERRSVARA
jgi:hypothetical protein